jgi:hypothetical protein
MTPRSPEPAKQDSRPKARRPRVSDITVIVRQSDEPVDVTAWAKRYVRAMLEHYRADCIAAGERPLL